MCPHKNMATKQMTITHFSRSEAACKCGCGFFAQDWELLEVLEDIRAFFGRPVIPNSWCRCPAYNERIGGANDSYHMKAMAADIWISGIGADIIADYLERLYPDRYGIGRYPGFTHIDVRPNKARWIIPKPDPD